MRDVRRAGGNDGRRPAGKRAARRTKVLCLGLMILSLFSLPGCGRQEEAPETDPSEETVRWKTEGFAAPGKPESGSELYAESYLPWDAEAGTQGEGLYDDASGVCGGLFWNLSSGTAQGADTRFLLTVYDTEKGSCVRKSFAPSDLGLSGETGCLQDMDMPDPDHIMLRWGEYTQDGEGQYRQSADRMVYVKLKTTEEGMDFDLSEDVPSVDLMATYLEKGILKEEAAELPLCQMFDWKCDSKGGLCILSEARLFLFDSEGGLWLEEEGGRGRQFLKPLRTPEGELIVPVYSDGTGYEFLWADAEAKELRSLAQMEAESPYIDQMCGMLGNDVFYQSRKGAEDEASGIIRWNIQSGTRTRIFDLQGNGIDVNYQIQLALPEGMNPCLRLIRFKNGESREWLARLTEEKPEGDRSVRWPA